MTHYSVEAPGQAPTDPERIRKIEKLKEEQKKKEQENRQESNKQEPGKRQK